MAPIVLAGTLDTKGAEIGYLRRLLSQTGLEVKVADMGVFAGGTMRADISRQEICAAGGEDLEALAAAGDRGRAVAAMQQGFAAWVREHRQDIAGILAIGGSAGTAIGTAGMRELPIGIPKLMVSTMASGEVRPYVGTCDITMMYSVVDFTGLNRLTTTILANAAAAIAGMCRREGVGNGESPRPLLAATMFGVTTPCVNRVREMLEAKGFELLVFHATGTGGQAMERLVADGFVKGVLDITTTELADELVGGVLSAGPNRLEAAGKAGVPQVVSTGALDMVNFGAPETVPQRFQGRRFYQHNSAVTLMRTTAEENRELGRILAGKLNQSKGPTTVILPLRGVSKIDADGQPFGDARADQELFDSIRAQLNSSIRLVELDLHINDRAFAEAIVSEFLSQFPAAASRNLTAAAQELA